MSWTSWKSGICAQCCDSKCLCACVLPCAVISDNVRIMGDNGFSDIPVVDFFFTDPKDTRSKSGCACLLYSLGILSGGLLSTCPCQLYYCNLLGCFSVYFHSRIRQTIRNAYGIPHEGCGDGCSDFCCALFCYSCAMAQEHATLEEMIEKKKIQTI
jgi:Cys-rich protein (TIGR01571 family)